MAHVCTALLEGIVTRIMSQKIRVNEQHLPIRAHLIRIALETLKTVSVAQISYLKSLSDYQNFT